MPWYVVWREGCEQKRGGVRAESKKGKLQEPDVGDAFSGAV